MKTTRLILGIITIVLFVIILFQSCAAGIVNTVGKSSDAGGSAGIFVAFLSLIAGIIAVAARSSAGGSMTAGAFYMITAITGISNSNVYKDLSVWGGLYFIFSLFFIISGVKQRKNKKKGLLG